MSRFYSLLLLLLGATPLAAQPYVYWANSITNTIGRANLDGTGVNSSFISGATYPAGVTVDGTYIYWVNYGNGTIGRANLDGSGANQSFITGDSSPTGVTVDGTYIYWTRYYSSTIGRANLDGSGVNQSFITGANNPYDVTVDGTYIYWANSEGGTIGRANLDGSGTNQSFISGTGRPWGIVTTNSGSLPVELTSFTATLDGSSALLRWTTASETNNAGFDVEHRQGSNAFRPLGFIPGHGTTAEAQRYAFTADDLAPGTHVFRLRQVDFDGAFEFSPEVELTIEADGLALALGSLTAGAIRGSVAVPNGQTARVTVFDALGRQVAAQDVAQGVFAVEAALASGVYVVRVEAGAQVITRSVVVAR